MNPRRRTARRVPRRWRPPHRFDDWLTRARWRFRDLALAVLVAVVLAVAAVQFPGLEYLGGGRIIDGDSLRVDGREIRLFGIDAPEAVQMCKTATGAPWPCGRAAAQALRRLIAGAQVRCRMMDEDRYGRAVAVCRAGKRDLGAALVLAGLALAYRDHSLRYVGEERTAKAARRGLWQGRFEKPWVWRRKRRSWSRMNKTGSRSGHAARAADGRGSGAAIP